MFLQHRLKNLTFLYFLMFLFFRSFQILNDNFKKCITKPNRYYFLEKTVNFGSSYLIFSNNLSILTKSPIQKHLASQLMKGKDDDSLGIFMNKRQYSETKLQIRPKGIFSLFHQVYNNQKSRLPNERQLMIQNHNNYYPSFTYFFLAQNYSINPYNGLWLAPASLQTNNSEFQSQKVKMQEIQELSYLNTTSALKQRKTEYNGEKDLKKENSQPTLLREDCLRIINNHNILPNKINLILSYIRRVNKSGKVVDKIINKLNKHTNDYSSKKYYAYQFYLKENLDGFTHKDSISILINHCDPLIPIFTVQEQLFYNKVCRILISYYLEEVSTFEVLHKIKLKNSKVKEHLVVHRYLNEVLKGKGELEKDYKL